MKSRRRRVMLSLVQTDSTFELENEGGQSVWRGKCLHCRRWLSIRNDGEPLSQATIEHIIPRNHGGTDDLENLGIACARCNHEKGRRHDLRRAGDPRLQEIVERLQAERMRRWRDPGSD